MPHVHSDLLVGSIRSFLCLLPSQSSQSSFCFVSLSYVEIAAAGADTDDIVAVGHGRLFIGSVLCDA